MFIRIPNTDSIFSSLFYLLFSCVFTDQSWLTAVDSTTVIITLPDNKQPQYIQVLPVLSLTARPADTPGKTLAGQATFSFVPDRIKLPVIQDLPKILLV